MIVYLAQLGVRLERGQDRLHAGAVLVTSGIPDQLKPIGPGDGFRGLDRVEPDATWPACPRPPS
jgi:hypothetical protein